MRSRSCFILIAVLTLACTNCVAAAPPLSVCQLLENPAKFDGKMVNIRSEIIMGGVHGAIAVSQHSDDCKGAINLVTSSREPLAKSVRSFLREESIGGFYSAELRGKFESHPQGMAGAPNVKGVIKIETVTALKREPKRSSPPM